MEAAAMTPDSISASFPPLPEDLPVAWRGALLALEGLSDPELEQALRATFPQEEYEQFAALREKSRGRALTATEQASLDRLTAEADLLPLQKAYAAVLLKWRGHRLPTLAELEAS
jgi:hypothetical protein